MRTFARSNGLSLFFLALFLVALVGQSLAGLRHHNAEQRSHESPEASYIEYVFSADFGEAVMENWQSEFLQFALFIFATVWLVQKGSNESKELDDLGLESDRQQRLGRHLLPSSPGWAKAGGWRTRLYSNSLIIVMTTLFLTTWWVQSLTAWRVWNEEQAEHGETTVSWWAYVGRADIWEKTLQNWQTEILAVGTMAVFTIYLRQRGSVGLSLTSQ
jgi:hypothetical protein